MGIGGGTASGKTTVARRLAEALGTTASILDMDAYYRDRSHLPPEERDALNFDHPDAFDVPLMVAQLTTLQRGEAIDKPVYTFATHAREPHTERVQPARVVLVEGILALAIPELTAILDVRIYVDTDDDIRVIRRLTRDVKERGRDFDSVVSQYMNTVRPMHLGFVEPSKRHADIIIPHGGNNTIAIGMVAAAIRGRVGA